MDLETTIDIDAPTSRVWDVLTDFERYPEWNPFVRTLRGEIREGARLHVELGPPGGKVMAFRPTVTKAAPRQALGWLGTLGPGWLFRGEHTFRLEALDGGRTRFHHGETFGGLLLPLLRKGLDTETRRGFEAMNAALKAEAERAPTTA